MMSEQRHRPSSSRTTWPTAPRRPATATCSAGAATGRTCRGAPTASPAWHGPRPLRRVRRAAHRAQAASTACCAGTCSPAAERRPPSRSGAARQPVGRAVRQRPAARVDRTAGTRPRSCRAGCSAARSRTADGERGPGRWSRTPSPDRLAAAHGVQSSSWVPALRHSWSRMRGPLADEVRRRRPLAYHWHRGLRERIERRSPRRPSRPWACPTPWPLVERLGATSATRLAPAARGTRPRTPPGHRRVPRAAGEGRRGAARARLHTAAQLARPDARPLRASRSAHHLNAQAALAGGPGAAAVRHRRARPAGDALRRGPARAWSVALDDQRADLGLARLATDQRDAVAHGRRPAGARAGSTRPTTRCCSPDTATSRSSTTPTCAGPDSSGAPRSPGEALGEVIAQAFSGRWTTTGSGISGGAARARSTWRSAVFPVNPLDSPSRSSRGTPRYDVHVRPAELLGRARLFVGRPGESFDRFCRVSISDFVAGDDVAAAERRTAADRRSSPRPCALARPLISVDSTALQAVHDGRRHRVPLQVLRGAVPGPPDVAEDLTRVLQTNPDDRPARACRTSGRRSSDTDAITRIDIFGSYPNYSPLVFDAVLAPVAEQWARHRRRRPRGVLAVAALPPADRGTADGRRRAAHDGDGLVARPARGAYPHPGAVAAGHTRCRSGTRSDDRWVAFPHPLLTPPTPVPRRSTTGCPPCWSRCCWPSRARTSGP